MRNQVSAKGFETRTLKKKRHVPSGGRLSGKGCTGERGNWPRNKALGKKEMLRRGSGVGCTETTRERGSEMQG